MSGGHDDEPCWRVPGQRISLPVLRPWGPEGEAWEGDEALGCYILRSEGAEIRCWVTQAEGSLTAERLEIHEGNALPIICPGMLYGWMFEESIRRASSKEGLGTLLLARLVGTEHLAEIAGGRLH